MEIFMEDGFNMSSYKILIHDKAYKKIELYFNGIQTGKLKTGAYLGQQLKNHDITSLQLTEFIELIVMTKKPQIFAESAVRGDGTDWNLAELAILGDISIAVPVKIYDNGKHFNPEVYTSDFKGFLIYTPGALLRNGRGCVPADFQEVTIENEINYKGYFALYERRLLPGFLYANDITMSDNKKVIITIPGLGCGQFAGEFAGQLGQLLKKVLIEILEKHGQDLSNIQAVYFDPYQECNNERYEINGISLLVRPFLKNNEKKPQLCKPTFFEDNIDDFSNCELFSIVAWDHVSWPGNDFYIGSRATDDGVKSAATNSMAVLTGVEGKYNELTNTYDPPEKYIHWGDLIQKDKITLKIKNNILVYPS